MMSLAPLQSSRTHTGPESTFLKVLTQVVEDRILLKAPLRTCNWVLLSGEAPR